MPNFKSQGFKIKKRRDIRHVKSVVCVLTNNRPTYHEYGELYESMRKKVAYVWSEVLIDGLKSSTLAWISLPSEVKNHQVTWTSKCPSKHKRTTTYISFILKPCDLKFGMHEVKILFYFMKPEIIHITLMFWFFRRLKRVGSVLYLGLELDPFLYIWYHTVLTQSGLSPCGQN